MAKIYYRLILSGDRTLDSVPERWRADVATLLGGLEQ